MHAYKDKTDIV